MPTLQDIRNKVRLITARPDQFSLTDNQLDDYINTYYLYDLPETLRLLNLRDFYTFITQPNVDTYNFDRNNYVTAEPYMYCDGYNCGWYQNVDSFYAVWPQVAAKIQVATGDGTPGPYNITTTYTPFLRSIIPAGTVYPNDLKLPQVTLRCLIEAQVNTSPQAWAVDDGNGGILVPDVNGNYTQGVGSIDYITGNIQVTFASAIPGGTPIFLQVRQYAASRPNSVLFFQDQFTLRPVPDSAYIMQVQAYRTPTSLFNNPNASPYLNEWWQLLAYGAALKIFADNADFEQLANFRPLLEEQLLFAQRRTLKQAVNQRTPTIYAPPAVGFAYPNTYPSM